VRTPRRVGLCFCLVREEARGEVGRGKWFFAMRVREGVAREIARGWKRVIYRNEKGERGLEMGVVTRGIRGKEKKKGESSHGQGKRERERGKKRKKRRKIKKRKGERKKFDFEIK
jgi:hypothetical protein